ncbi:hypothetical protein NPIL_5971 [Nephila pilipes]|uniref:Uncharacterized protein n=1 Tax=Nephila pilipes TaxID=299642 RepID=A0A8X6P9L0_NEPPI|nr:hypothetical protein NPIL_5971 [Nephila pilipes]
MMQADKKSFRSKLQVRRIRTLMRTQKVSARMNDSFNWKDLGKEMKLKLPLSTRSAIAIKFRTLLKDSSVLKVKHSNLEFKV